MNLFRYYHSPAIFAFRDRSFTVQMILPDEERDLETVSLAFVVEGNGQSGTLRMLPVDGLVLEESYSVYAATVSADVLRDGYAVTVGKNGNQEIDFCAKKDSLIEYYQVAYLLASEETVRREFCVFNSVKDNYPKFVLSMDKLDFSQNGIIHKNITDWLLGHTA